MDHRAISGMLPRTIAAHGSPHGHAEQDRHRPGLARLAAPDERRGRVAHHQGRRARARDRRHRRRRDAPDGPAGRAVRGHPRLPEGLPRRRQPVHVGAPHRALARPAGRYQRGRARPVLARLHEERAGDPAQGGQPRRAAREHVQGRRHRSAVDPDAALARGRRRLLHGHRLPRHHAGPGLRLDQLRLLPRAGARPQGRLGDDLQGQARRYPDAQVPRSSGKPCPIAVVVGVHPSLWAVAGIEIPYGKNEFDAAGGLHRRRRSASSRAPSPACRSRPRPRSRSRASSTRTT